MKIDHSALSVSIISLIGGKDNIAKLTHCATRLRFELHDQSIIHVEDLKNLDGVIDTVDGGGQFQIIVGQNVQQLYKLINTVLQGNQSKSPSASKSARKFSGMDQIFNTVATIFTPMIPAITGAGMIKAALALLVVTKSINTDGHTYYIINMISDAAFYFLPILLAYGAALKFETNTGVSLAIAGILLHPSWISLLGSQGDVSFLSVPLTLIDYGGSVLPIILTVWFQSYIEKFADKYTPEMIKFFIKPLITILITGVVALLIIGPFGSFLNDVIAAGANIINKNVSWLIPLLMGAFQPLMLLTGTAWSLTPIATIQLSQQGFEQVNGPGMLASNIAQGGATLAVAFKTKKLELKETAFSSGITALLGITEPSLFGVTIKYKNALIAAMIGGGSGGIYAGLSGLVRYAFASPGLAALPVFIGENPFNIVHAIITCLISFVTSFIISFIITKVE
ncbi:MAG: PTS transporter subunit EIIC [Brevinema sp.]